MGQCTKNISRHNTNNSTSVQISQENRDRTLRRKLLIPQSTDRFFSSGPGQIHRRKLGMESTRTVLYCITALFAYYPSPWHSLLRLGLEYAFVSATINVHLYRSTRVVLVQVFIGTPLYASR